MKTRQLGVCMARADPSCQRLLSRKWHGSFAVELGFGQVLFPFMVSAPLADQTKYTSSAGHCQSVTQLFVVPRAIADRRRTCQRPFSAYSPFPPLPMPNVVQMQSRIGPDDSLRSGLSEPNSAFKASEQRPLRSDGEVVAGGIGLGRSGPWAQEPRMARGAPRLDFVGQDVFVPGDESGQGQVPRGHLTWGGRQRVGSVVRWGEGTAGPEEFKPIDASELTTSERKRKKVPGEIWHRVLCPSAPLAPGQTSYTR